MLIFKTHLSVLATNRWWFGLGNPVRFAVVVSLLLFSTLLIAATPQVNRSCDDREKREDTPCRWLVEKRVSNLEVRFGYIDRTGHLAIPMKYEMAYPFQNGLAAVMEAGAWKFIDPSGKIIFAAPVGTNDFGHYSDGLVAVHIGGKVSFERVDGGEWYYANADGKCAFDWKITSSYDSPLQIFSEGRAGVRTGDKWGIINRAGETIVPPRYEMVLPFTNGMAAVKEKGKWGFIDQNGQLAIPTLLSYASPFSEGLAGVSLGKGLLFIEKSGARVFQLPDPAGPVGSFSEGLAAALLPEEGAVRIGLRCVECKADLKALSYGDTCPKCGAAIEPRALWGYVDRTGKRIVSPRFSAALPFKDHLAAVREGEEADARWGFIDGNGSLVIPCRFREKHWKSTSGG